MREVIVLLGAEIEIQAAYERCWSQRQADDLDSRFRAALVQLGAQPRSGRPYGGKFHRLVVSRTDYGFFYIIELRGVVVHALLDLRQSSETIRRRLGLAD